MHACILEFYIMLAGSVRMLYPRAEHEEENVNDIDGSCFRGEYRLYIQRYRIYVRILAIGYLIVHIRTLGDRTSELSILWED